LAKPRRQGKRRQNPAGNQGDKSMKEKIKRSYNKFKSKK